MTGKPNQRTSGKRRTATIALVVVFGTAVLTVEGWRRFRPVDGGQLTQSRQLAGPPRLLEQASGLARGGLSGVVQDVEGRRLERATLVLIPRETEQNGRSLAPAAVTTTDATGIFAFSDLLAGQYFLTVGSPGYLPTTSALTVSQSEPAPATIVLERGGFLIAGRVLDAEGGPIVGTRISRIPSGFPGDEAALFVADSGDDGRFRLSVPGGEHTLVFRRDGYAEKAVEVRAHRDQEIDVRLSAGIRLAGKVVAREDGKPVPEASVHIRLVRTSDDIARAVTDDEGHFAVGGLAADTYEVTARKGGRVGTLDQPLRLLPPGERAVFIALYRGTTISGQVVRRSGHPVSGARLFLGRTDSSGARGDQVSLSDGDGRFTIRGALPVHTSIVARADGHASGSRRIRVLEGEDLAEIKVILPDTGALLVRVAEGGAAKPDALVSVWSSQGMGLDWKAEGRTSSEGLVHFQVPTGNLTIFARTDEAEGRTEVALPEHQDAMMTSVELRPVPRVVVEGRVTWRDGGRPAAVPVFVHCQGRGWDHTRADASGAYRFEGCQPGSLYLQAFSRDVGLDEWIGGYLAAQVPLPLQAGEPRRRVDLAVSAAGKRISGRVLLPRGGGAASFIINVRGQLEERATLTDDDGGFLFSDLARQRHWITVKAPGYRELRSVTAEADADGLLLQLMPGQSLQGVVVSSDGKARPYARVLARSAEASVESYSGARGAFVLDGLVPGRHDLYVRGDSGDLKVASVVVEVGRQSNVRLVADDGPAPARL